MDGNKDEAQRCINIALDAARSGDLKRAEKFLRKADSLYPSQNAKDLLADIKSRETETKDSSDGVRKRNTNAKAEASQSKQSDTSSGDYTKEQLEMCERILRCKDYYEILRITKEATDSEIKRAYKKLALQLHPDKNRAPGAVEAFKALGNAAGVLTDAEKRKHYDMFGSKTDKGPKRHYHTNHEYEHAYRGAGSGFDSDFTAEELFNMFFGGGFPQARQTTQRQYASRRESTHYQNHQQQPSLAFSLILILVLISMLASFFTSDPVYSLSQTGKYNVIQRTHHLNIPYYVRDTFKKEYQGSLHRLENSIEEEYIMVMKQNCMRERSYRELMIAKARNFGNERQLEEAKGFKVSSCDNLARLGLTKYILH
ncbi:dnaJ homolog subfamily B member 14-like [Contarinia nasturtii]|uniref:dnaJ homolog subfamily B member 14-like n=1 Tax=Contarinia nasturtii TaxID=265458 RepID=UPI0012D475BA|nr:dnaJ homolog subfamily B member 14-like [Contarinia nasturtii]